MDREKVIKGLETCRTRVHCKECPYVYDKRADDSYCEAVMHNDALALLKEQEAVDPEVEVLNEIEMLYKCPKCHKHFFYRKQKYCDQCGQAVKWNESPNSKETDSPLH